MSEQINKIERAIVELFHRETAYEQALSDSAAAEHIYRMKKNEMFLNSEGTEKVKMAEAEILCRNEMLLKLTCDAKRDALKAKLDDARTVISARKEILRVESNLTGQN